MGSIYLILGFLYQRFIVGAKGMEQIPNYKFWRDFGSLQAVSFLFTLYSTMYPSGRGGGYLGIITAGGGANVAKLLNFKERMSNGQCDCKIILYL